MRTLKLGLFLLFVISMTGIQAQDCRNMMLTSGSYSETVNFQNVIRRDLGGNYTMADWNDLKRIPNIDVWISCMQLRREQSFMVTRNGNPIFSGKRQYNVQYFPTGRIPAGFLIHDKIDNKLFLGSWYGLNTNILAVRQDGPGNDVRRNDGRGNDDQRNNVGRNEVGRNEVGRNEVGRNVGQDFADFKITFNSFTEKQDLVQAARREFQGRCAIADWNDLKSIPNIDRWILRMDLQRDQTFFVTRNGKMIFAGNRQFFVLYSPSGRIPSGFIAHDRIDNKLFLGSWFGERRQILVKEFRNR